MLTIAVLREPDNVGKDSADRIFERKGPEFALQLDNCIDGII